MKKVFIGLFMFLLCAGNSGLWQMGKYAMSRMSAWDSQYSCSFAKTWPLDPAEEESSKESKENVATEDDEYVSHKWSSFKLSGISLITRQEAELLFERIDREIIVPPPRG